MTDQGTRFVVLTTQRSGSTWLMSVLNSIEGVSAQGELFLDRPRTKEKRWDSDFSRPRYIESRAEVGSLRPFSVFRYLDAFYGSGASVGFKLMYSQVKAYPEIVPYLMKHGIRVIHLVRRNHLDVLISFGVKREIGLAHILAPDDRPKEVMIDLDPGSLLREIRRLELKQDIGRRMLQMCRLRHVEIAYEDLSADITHFDYLTDFLEISAGSEIPQSHILKSRLGTQRQVVRNYDEVRRILATSKYSGLLE